MIIYQYHNNDGRYSFTFLIRKEDESGTEYMFDNVIRKHNYVEEDILAGYEVIYAED